MTTPSHFQLLHGRDEPPTELRELHAGPVTAQLDGIDLRYVKLGSVELVRRIYVAVRDESWGTLASEISNLDLDAQDDRFSLEFDVSNRAGDIDFRWHGSIVGDTEGTIRSSMQGVAGSDFKYNRIGFCVLHPPRENAGRPYWAEAPDGPSSGTLPLLIGPQRFEEGVLWPVLPPYTALAIDLEAGGEVRIQLEGDLFEMEDQRNWTDASFKTYSTPLSLGFPHNAEEQQRIDQRVTVSTSGLPAPAAPEPIEVNLALREGLGRTLPAIGLGMASHGKPLVEAEVTLLDRLHLDHLRVDLHLADAGFEQELERATAECAALRCGLEIGLFFTDENTAGLTELAALLESGPEVARFLVFKEGSRANLPDEATPRVLVDLARERLQAATPDAAFAGGTDMDFCQLNRSRPDIEAMDAVYWSINPQVHAFDDIDLMETLEAQADTVRSARAFAGGLPLVVSAITLRPRWNPYAAGPQPEPAPDVLPSQVDPRQMSRFGAAWTLGSVKYLAEAGVASLTYYETTGWRGVMEMPSGSPLPELFPSTPGRPFPLFEVFEALAKLKDAEVVLCQSNDPLRAVGLALRNSSGTTVVVSNLTPEEQSVVLDSEVSLELGPYAIERAELE